MEDKKVKKLKWKTPILERFDKSKMSRGDCNSGSNPGGGFEDCISGSLASGCDTGTGAFNCGTGGGPVF